MTRSFLALLLAAYPALAAIQVTSAHLVRTPPPGILLPRTPVEAESDFLTTDPAAFYLLTWTGGIAADKIRLEWRSPAGVVVQQNEHAAVTGVAQNRVIWKLLIAGGPAASTPGNWQVHLFYNGQSISTADFKISAPPETTVNIGTRSQMPDATISVPYYLQLTAHGGKPPYKWTTVKALPNGLTLSDAGIVSGTPVRRGSYRAIVEARDSAGNSVVRTFGLGIGAPAASDVKAATRNLLKAAGPDACSQTVSQTGFSASDSDAVLAFTLAAPRGREGRIEWLDPGGSVFQMTHVTKAAERQECIVKTLPLAGHRAVQMPGEWRVRLFWSDLEVFTLKFTVTAAGPGTVPRAPVAARSGRIAVLIANQRYDKLPASKLVAADLDALANTLRQDGFEVVRTSDATLENLRAIENTLEGKLQSGDTALVYYAGYDARAGGDYWLLPANFDPAGTGPMQSRAYSALRLLQWLEDSKAGLKFVFLDGALPAGQTGENLGAVMGEVDESTALVYSRNPVPGAFARALAGVLGKPEIDARTALGVELTKVAGNPAPVPILGGGADFVFRSAIR